MKDILDTANEGKEVELTDNKIAESDDVNLLKLDPTLTKIVLATGWERNAISTDILDLDISLFLLDKNGKTRMDSDFIFYNQPEALEGGIVHAGDNRTGIGEGDDEAITIDLQSIPFDIMQVAIMLSIYKGYEKEQNLDAVRKAYLRIINADNEIELLRFEIGDIFAEKTETGAILGMLNREGPKWHYKADIEFIPGGLSEVARRYDLIINQE
jgi:tellurium resistance protein TerD